MVSIMRLPLSFFIKTESRREKRLNPHPHLPIRKNAKTLKAQSGKFKGVNRCEKELEMERDKYIFKY